jgi:hypothetical protein
MATQVQIDGIGTVELDDSFKTKAPAEQQAIVDGIANQHAAQTQPLASQGGNYYPPGDSRNGPSAMTIGNTSGQPSVMDQIIGSPLGRGVHDFAGGMAKSVAASVDNLASAAQTFLPAGSVPIVHGMLPAATNAAIDQPYNSALARDRNTPGYAAARKDADKIQAKAGGDGGGFTGQMLAPLMPAMAGAAGLPGGWDAMNANADAQTARQDAYASDHPLLSTVANLTGSLMLGGPKLADAVPAYAGDSALLTRLGHGKIMGPLPMNPAKIQPSGPLADLPQLTPQAANQAGQYVSGLMRSAGKTAADLPQAASLLNGRPITSAEAIGQPGITGLGALARRPGATADTLRGMVDERADAAPDRVLADYAAATSIDPSAARGDLQALVTKGRQDAAPLYQQAFQGGSIAPLQDQLRTALTPATGAKGQIAKQIAAIEQNSPGALISHGAAGADIRSNYMDLHQRLQQAEADRQSTLGMFQKASQDATTNAPGAVWSPRVQQFLDDPILRQGINKGLEIQRLESLADNKPFNPTEYGVTGTDTNGAPVIGNVPNMRLLDAGKRGLDAILREQYTNPNTQRVMLTDPRAKAIDNVRRAYVGELDNLNPDYAAARGKAGDYLSAQTAFDNGSRMILNGNLPARDFAQHFQTLSLAEQEAFKGGIANKLFNMAQNSQINLKMFNRPIVQQKLATALGPQNSAAFLTKIKAEAQMGADGRLMSPGNGSGTQGWKAAMDAQDGSGFELPAGAVDMGMGVAHGNLPRFLGGASKMAGNATAYLRTPGMPLPVRDAAGKLLMLPPQDLATYLAKSGTQRRPLPTLSLPRLGLIGSALQGNGNGNQ